MATVKCFKCGKQTRENRSWEVYKDENGNLYNWKLEGKENELIIIGLPIGARVTKVHLGYDCYVKQFPK